VIRLRAGRVVVAAIATTSSICASSNASARFTAGFPLILFDSLEVLATVLAIAFEYREFDFCHAAIGGLSFKNGARPRYSLLVGEAPGKGDADRSGDGSEQERELPKDQDKVQESMGDHRNGSGFVSPSAVEPIATRALQ
jgi:hypothetical protein